MKKNILFTLLFILVFVSCSNEEDKIEQAISEIPVTVKTVRFDSLFFNTKEKDFQKLKSKYPYMFPANTSDSVWFQKQKDTLQQELYAEVVQEFPQTLQEEKALKNLFQHVKYYFPKFKTPKILFLTSDVDYRSRVIYSDTLLLVGLDNYLGKDHRFYQNIQEYIRNDFEKQNIPVDVASEIAEYIVPTKNTFTFLDALVQEGKQEYLIQLFLPKTPEFVRLEYSEQKWQWAEANESEIWRYFIQNELLYSTDKKLLTRFIYPAPFSKFYMELDNESPGEIGKFIGLKIVQSYMKNNKVSLQEMLNTPSTEIFKKSQYKPQK